MKINMSPIGRPTRRDFPVNDVAVKAEAASLRAKIGTKRKSKRHVLSYAVYNSASATRDFKNQARTVLR